MRFYVGVRVIVHEDVYACIYIHTYFTLTLLPLLYSSPVTQNNCGQFIPISIKKIVTSFDVVYISVRYFKNNSGDHLTNISCILLISVLM